MGSSQVIDPFAFPWRDAEWSGLSIVGQVLYEMHVGTFTPEGTWAAAAGKLAYLKDIGVTVVNMDAGQRVSGPVRLGGYDGVDIFAPTHLYGTPDDLRRFVDAAHAIGLGVILDVVYNHIGPDGNFLKRFAEDYFTDRHTTDWGEAPELRRTQRARDAGPRDQQRRLLDRGVPLRWAAPRCDAEHPTTIPTTTSSRLWAGRPARRQARAASS